MRALSRRGFVVSAVAVGLCAGCKGSASTSEAIGPLLAPSALAARLADVKAGKIAVLYVGPDMLFDLGHVPGARSIGAAGSEEGMRALSAELAKIPADVEVVLYCGCCPVSDCPNVRPASAALRRLGRTNAHVLDLPTRFATDWVDKGYPTEPQ